ncbi:DUF1800 family protein [Novosphingobium flavum]|uniref:DUF1800 domain-containing protein n=1 Tax=Novosphingobium aerophilum TaxID=2839843 RepID=UPI00163A7EBB|nr:DUF1800 family protein [Novosphingobium aerophilum]MBC2660274.1 DUF1800 family protein [Novosphingobium aerophilum]
MSDAVGTPPKTRTPAAAEPAAPSAPDRGGIDPRLGLAGASLGAVLLEACGDGGSGSSPGGGTITPAAITTTQASRFLSQASVGYGRTDVINLAGSSYNAWLDTQLAMARPQKFWDFLIAGGYDAAANINSTAGFDAMMWSQLINSGDILRQRVGLALLSIWVVGIDGLTSSWRSFVMAAYLDGLWDNAFGNYRDIMEFVSTSPAMAQFLTFLGNSKANPTTGSIPDENYARELMQLFTIGLYQLNMDGSQVLSGGAPVATYTQADVSQAARVWTGYTLANTDNTTPARMRLPLIINNSTRETGASSLLNGAITIPAGTDGATARKILLDGLFNHASMPPFISKQLIQRLVTSNPSPAYINRVANVFVNNGNGVRGDMKAVIRAILTDAEARDDNQVTSTSFGKLREPILRLTQWARAFNVTSPTNQWPFGNTSSTANRLGQSPGRSPSVFNWFRPGYTPPGTAISAAGQVAPEFQIANEPTIIAYVNYMQSLIASGAGEAKPDYSSLTTIATDSQALLAELNLVLAANQISSATIAQMKSALDTIAVTTTTGINNRIYAAILLVMASPEYLVLR